MPLNSGFERITILLATFRTVILSEAVLLNTKYRPFGL